MYIKFGKTYVEYYIIFQNQIASDGVLCARQIGYSQAPLWIIVYNVTTCYVHKPSHQLFSGVHIVPGELWWREAGWVVSLEEIVAVEPVPMVSRLRLSPRNIYLYQFDAEAV